MGLEQSPISLVSTIEELLGRNTSGNTLCSQKLALISPTSSSCSVCLVRLWTEATEFSLVYLFSPHVSPGRRLGACLAVCRKSIIPELKFDKIS
jgi:hypothetical protein